MKQIVAIIPAAGRSTRMGSAKALVDVGGRTMVEGVVEPLVVAGIDRIVVVTNTEIAALLPEGVRQRIQVAINDDASSEMIDSVRIGLRAIVPEGELAAVAGILVCPVDHPAISASDMRKCAEAFLRGPDRIVVASYNGRRGHPIIFPAAFVDYVNSSACDQGLNRLVDQYADLTDAVECQSPAVVCDLDTPKDVLAAFEPVRSKLRG